MFFILASYGQKSTLLQNINFRAKELKHSLNKDGDSLILESEKTIYSVEIFNQEFERTVEVSKNQTKIPLNETPLGRLVVEAKLVDKRIIMTLLRHEVIEEISEPEVLSRPMLPNVCLVRTNQIITANTFDVCSEIKTLITLEIKPKAKITTLKNQKSSQETTPKNIESSSITTNHKDDRRDGSSISSMLNWKRAKSSKSNKIFWVSYFINSGNSSRKIMKIVNHYEADKLILKYKAERKTNLAKLNKLTIWEIYDSVKFLKKQFENTDYIHSRTSDVFNVTPYFTSTKKLNCS